MKTNKAITLFTKMKQKLRQPGDVPDGPTLYQSGQGIPIRDVEPNLDELGYRAMNSYRLQPEVVKYYQRSNSVPISAV